MKKLVLMAVAIAAVSFASCGGNKAADTTNATEEPEVTTVEEVATEATEEVAADTLVADSVAVETVETAE